MPGVRAARHDGRVTAVVGSVPGMSGALRREVRPDRPVSLDATLGLLQRGSHDLTHRKIGGSWLRATRTPVGPALLQVSSADTVVSGTAWGPGAEWVLDRLPRLLGGDDDPSDFRPRPEHPALVEAHRRYGWFRIAGTDAVFEALTCAIIEQKVTGHEAFGAYRRLLQHYGEPAPGPGGRTGSVAYPMVVPPDPRTWASIPSWRYLRAGLESSRSRTLVGAAGRASAIERTLHRDPLDADRGLRSLPGVGAWTSAEVRQRAHGDADAWSVGDYHVGKDITWALTGQVQDDDACAEILEPYRGHRYRVQVLLELAGLRRPRRAPRMTLPSHTPYATGGRS